jgi:mannose-1-phosphate guanylyltransferase
MKAMILAAGLGTRLLPYTLKRPKPLFPILNRPLLHLTISRIKQAGAQEIIINAHHLRSQIKEALLPEANITLQEEEEILGTGGGLRLALSHLGSDPVLVVNGDIYHSIDYNDVYSSHCASGTDVTLVLHDYPRFNDVRVDDTLKITGFGKPGGSERKQERTLAFTGIHVINPEVLHTIPQDTQYCIIDCYRKLLQKGNLIGSYVARNHFWTDMGTPTDYLQLHADLLAHKAPIYGELAETAAAAPFIGLENASVSRDARLLDWVCIGKGATIEAGTTLQRTVVWDDAVVPAGSTIIDGIVTL